MSFNNIGANQRNEVTPEAQVVSKYTEGDAAVAPCDEAGVPYTHQANLAASSDKVQAAGYGGTPTQNNVVASTVSATVAAANSSRKGIIVSNQDGTVALFRYGDTACSATNYGFAVPAGTTQEFDFVGVSAIQMINPATTASGRVAVLEIV